VRLSQSQGLLLCVPAPSTLRVSRQRTLVRTLTAAPAVPRLICRGSFIEPRPEPGWRLRRSAQVEQSSDARSYHLAYVRWPACADGHAAPEVCTGSADKGGPACAICVENLACEIAALPRRDLIPALTEELVSEVGSAEIETYLKQPWATCLLRFCSVFTCWRVFLTFTCLHEPQEIVASIIEG
jgi:hypothetical protein